MATERKNALFVNKILSRMSLILLFGIILLSGCASGGGSVSSSGFRMRVGGDVFCHSDAYGTYGQDRTIMISSEYIDCYLKICGSERRGCSANNLSAADQCMRSKGYRIGNECN
jgi:hypothetical protein